MGGGGGGSGGRAAGPVGGISDGVGPSGPSGGVSPGIPPTSVGDQWVTPLDWSGVLSCGRLVFWSSWPVRLTFSSNNNIYNRYSGGSGGGALGACSVTLYVCTNYTMNGASWPSRFTGGYGLGNQQSSSSYPFVVSGLLPSPLSIHHTHIYDSQSLAGLLDCIQVEEQQATTELVATAAFGYLCCRRT